MTNEKTQTELQKSQFDKTKKLDRKNQHKKQQKISKKKNLFNALRKNLTRRKVEPLN